MARSSEIANQMAAPNQPGPVTVVTGARFEIEPQRAPGPRWLLESADRSRVGVVVASKTLSNVWVSSADQMNVPCGTPLTAPHVTYNRAGNEEQRSSVGLRSLVESVFSSYGHAFRNACELSASIIPIRSQKCMDRRLVPLRFLESCLQPPLLPGFYPHSQGATWGPVHVGVRSQTWPLSPP